MEFKRCGTITCSIATIALVDLIFRVVPVYSRSTDSEYLDDCQRVEVIAGSKGAVAHIILQDRKSPKDPFEQE